MVSSDSFLFPIQKQATRWYAAWGYEGRKDGCGTTASGGVHSDTIKKISATKGRGVEAAAAGPGQKA